MKEFVEKLIERLEEEKFSHTQFDGVMPEEIDVVTIGSVKKIVKDLASEHNNDFCEWRKENSNEYVCDAHAEIHDSRVLDWCVCPYCGKEIKVIPAPYKKGE